MVPLSKIEMQASLGEEAKQKSLTLFPLLISHINLINLQTWND